MTIWSVFFCTNTVYLIFLFDPCTAIATKSADSSGMDYHLANCATKSSLESTILEGHAFFREVQKYLGK